MKITPYEMFSSTETKFELDINDFNYLSKEFKVIKSLNGFDLESIKNPKLSIHISDYCIKYDRDISERKMMIATERVDVMIGILSSVGKTPHSFKQYIPKTTHELETLIDEFKYCKLGETIDKNILNFLQKYLVD